MIFVSVFSPTVCEDGRIFCVDVVVDENINDRSCNIRVYCEIRSKCSEVKEVGE